MRWTMPALTVASLAALAGMIMYAQGPQVLEALNLRSDAEADRTIPVNLLAELSSPDVHKQLDWSFEKPALNQDASATHAPMSMHTFLNAGDVTDEEAEAAIADFQQRVVAARTAPMTTGGYVDHAPQHQGLNPQILESDRHTGAYTDYSYIPRMQRFGLTRTGRYNNVNALHGRDYVHRTRLGRQQRAMDQLRARVNRYGYGRGRVVYREQ